MRGHFGERELAHHAAEVLVLLGQLEHRASTSTSCSYYFTFTSR
jgi:hypothetical protein